jgi:hypothetical protein
MGVCCNKHARHDPARSKGAIFKLFDFFLVKGGNRLAFPGLFVLEQVE